MLLVMRVVIAADAQLHGTLFGFNIPHCYSQDLPANGFRYSPDENYLGSGWVHASV